MSNNILGKLHGQEPFYNQCLPYLQPRVFISDCIECKENCIVGAVLSVILTYLL